MLPTFIVPGAGKSGTTALWTYLREHPEIGTARVKEPMFFTRVRGRRDGGGPDAPARSGQFDRGLAWYESLFAGCAGARARGEASTAYMHAPDAPGLIRATLPDVQLVFVLRSPVERAYSQYWEEVKQGWRLPPFEAMVAGGHPRLARYLGNSAYGVQLGRYLALFPREQVLVVCHEDLRAAPAATLRRVHAFLGVRPDFVPSALGRGINDAGAPRVRLLQRLLWLSYAGGARRVVPPPARRLLGALRARVARANQRPVRYPPLAPALRAQLAGRFEPDIAAVEALVGRALPHWRTGGAA